MKIQALNAYDETSTEAKTDEYPYGFLRCSAKWWIEDKGKKGQRVIFQTVNPKTNRVNAPKKATYNLVSIIYRNPENNHFEVAGVSQYASSEEIEKFLNTYEGLREKDIETLNKRLKIQKVIDAKFASGELKFTIKVSEPISLSAMMG